MSDFNIEFEENDQQIKLEFESGVGGAVSSVNGMTGDVVLTASDVGALPTSTPIPTVDSTLAISGAAADAKKVGDEISTVKDGLNTVKNDISELIVGVPTTVRQAIKTLLESGAYADTGLTDEMAVVSSWASQVTAITLNQSSISISGATTSQLTATTTPSGGTVTWSSSNTSVATVSSNGLVTGVANGTAIITATSGDVSATCSVAVSGIATLSSISAVYTQSGTVYDTTPLDSLKTDLVVTATYSDSSSSTVPSTDYTLSGTLTVGTSAVTVSYGGKTTSFNVVVQESTITIEVEGPNTSLNESSEVGTSYNDCKKYNQDRYCPVSPVAVSIGDVINLSASNIGTNTLGIYLLWFDSDQNYTGVHSSSWNTSESYTVDQSYPYLGFAISTRPTQTAIRNATDITVTLQRN